MPFWLVKKIFADLAGPKAISEHLSLNSGPVGLILGAAGPERRWEGAVMQITANKVAGIHYTLKNKKGEQIESSVGAEPLVYLHGNGNLISGLETQLEGKKAGDKFTAHVKASDAYGEYDQELVETVDKADFEDQNELAVGKEFQYSDDEGEIYHVRIVKIDGETVTVDGNHPLAGQDLTFDVEVVSVREASEEELDHGHVHDGSGHHHHD